MKFVTKKMHAYLDYPVALALMGLPFLLGVGESYSLGWELSMVVGVAAFLLTLLTDHELGVYKIISYKTHLFVDAAVGVLFVTAPFLFGFEGIDAYYYWINGGAVLIVVSLHKPQPVISK